MPTGALGEFSHLGFSIMDLPTVWSVAVKLLIHVMTHFLSQSSTHTHTHSVCAHRLVHKKITQTGSQENISMHTDWFTRKYFYYVLCRPTYIVIN